MPEPPDLSPPKSTRGATVEKRLKLYIAAADLVSFGVFLRILTLKIPLASYFATWPDVLSPPHWLAYLKEQGLITAAFISVVLLFVFSRGEAKRSFEIATKLFSRARVPLNWQRVESGWTIVPRIIVFLLIFFGMAWFIDNPIILSILLASIFLHNAWGNLTIRANIAKFFATPDYYPHGDPHEAFIMRRRTVAQSYLDKPHVRRELAVVGASLAALAAAIAGNLLQKRPLELGTYAILVVALWTNEFVVSRWRRERALAIAQIEDDEEHATYALTEAATAAESRNQDLPPSTAEGRS